MQAKLTKTVVERGVVGGTIWDTEVKGFGVRINGQNSRTYVLKTRCKGRQRWITIGRHGSPWTVQQARTEALALLLQIKRGEDPVSMKQRERSAVTVAQFSERYLREHAEVRKKQSSVDEDKRNLKNHIIPSLGKLRMKDLTRDDVHRLMMAMKDRPYAANRCRALISHMCKKAESWSVRSDNSNPCIHVEPYPEKPRERYLDEIELVELGDALRDSERKGVNPFVVAAIRLLLVTGARLSEVLKLKWDEIDLVEKTINLSDSKTGQKTIYLGSAALAIIENIPKVAGNPHVICGRKEGSHLVNIQRPWRKIRSAAGLEGVRIHDLRHSFGATAASGGLSIPLIAALLGHTQLQTTARYAHVSANPRLIGAEQVSRELAGYLN